MADVEKALKANFEIKDDISAAEIMKQLAKENIIEAPLPIKAGDVTVTQLSSSCIEVNKDGNSAIMLKDRIDSGRLAAMGVTEKEKTSIVKSFEKSEKAAKHPERQTLQTLKNYASEAREKINAVKDKTKEIAKSKTAKGQER